jgi:hypothetical protein
MERLLGTLRTAGFDSETTYRVYHLLDGYIFGFTLWEIAYTSISVDSEAASKLMQSIPWDEYPQLTEHRDQHMSDGPHHEVSAFEVGLDLILDGLQKTLGSPSS